MCGQTRSIFAGTPPIAPLTYQPAQDAEPPVNVAADTTEEQEPPVNVAADTTEEQEPPPAPRISKRLREKMHRQRIESEVNDVTGEIRDLVDNALWAFRDGPNATHTVGTAKFNKIVRALRTTLLAELKKELTAK